jgi:hypothetical protein
LRRCSEGTSDVGASGHIGVGHGIGGSGKNDGGLGLAGGMVDEVWQQAFIPKRLDEVRRCRLTL